MNQKESSFMSNTNDLLVSILKQTRLTATPHELQKFLELANIHGVLPQCYKAFKRADSLSVYPKLQQNYQSILQANLMLTAHLLLLTKTLEREGFPYLAIKGPTLSQELHSDISMRQFSDIDIFIEQKDIYKISELLITLDYTPVLPLSLLSRTTFLALDNDFSFRHNRSNALLELHWQLFPPRHKMPLDFTQLYKASKIILLQQKKIHTLSTEHNLLYLSLHGAKHIFERYEWVYDLHTLMLNNPNLDIEHIYLQAKKNHLDIPLLLGIFLSRELFETPIPATFYRYKTEYIQTLIGKVMDYYEKGFVYWDESDKKRARFLFLGELFQSQESKSLWLAKSLFKTTPVDVITFNLPNALSFLYPLLRPFRLLYKHLLTKKPQYDQT